MLVLALSAMAAIAYAPYLPRLLVEGYPRALWPAPGSFAALAGGDGSAPAPGPTHQPNAELLALFEAAEGRAVLAARDGRLVIERYAEGVDRETRLNSYSLAKSLIGLLVLKAVADGHVGGLDTPLEKALPEFAGRPIGHLPLCRLTSMRSGIGFEPDAKKEAVGLEFKDLEATRLNLLGPMGRLHMTGLAGVVDRLDALDPAEHPAAGGCEGGRFSYQNVNTALAGAILERAYGMPLERLVAEQLWQPAGAAPAEWRRYGDGLPVTPYCCIYARPLDWLKVAQFIAGNGLPGAPLLPEPLWRRFLGLDLEAAALADGEYRDFAYHNVLDRPGEPLQGRFAYFFGSRGQIVYLMPERKLVVVRFGGAIQKLHSTLYAVGRSIDD